jgi:hypothetical protein
MLRDKLVITHSSGEVVKVDETFGRCVSDYRTRDMGLKLLQGRLWAKQYYKGREMHEIIRQYRFHDGKKWTQWSEANIEKIELIRYYMSQGKEYQIRTLTVTDIEG